MDKDHTKNGDIEKLSARVSQIEKQVEFMSEYKLVWGVINAHSSLLSELLERIKKLEPADD